MDIYEQIIKQTDAIADDLTAQRRDFHKYAEKGWFEMRTSSIIARKLTDLGYEVLVGDQVCKRDSRMGVPSEEELDKQYERAVAQGADPEFVKYTKGGMTGVIGILRCGEGPTVAMRFDIDALGVFEEHDSCHRPAREGFASVNEGFMHACGHDAHATIGLGVAKVLMSIKDSLHGTVKLIFQPAEEGVRGAKSIVDNGHLDGVNYLIGSHVTDTEDGDPAVVIPGSYGSLATTKYDVVFRGQAAHAGFMFEVENASAVLEMAHYIVALMGLACREKDTTVNVGIAQGGTAKNVVADFAKISVDMRFKLDEERIRLKEAVHKLTEGEPFVKGVKTVIAEERESRPLVKTEKTAEFVERMKGLAEELGILFQEKDRGGLSDANHLAQCGDAVVLDGMGPHGANDHSEKEYGYIGSVEPCVRLLVRVLQDLAERK